MTSVRYEDGAWPLWRVDLGVRYGVKSILHQRKPHPHDAAYFRKMHRYLGVLAHAPMGSAVRREVRVAAVGDVMWISRGWERPWSARVASQLSSADVCFANLETPADPSRPVPRATYASFNAPRSFISRWRTDAGPSVLSLCNNHVLDCGLGGLRRTRELVRAHPELWALGGLDAHDATAIVSLPTARIGVFGTTFGINPWSHGVQPEHYPAGVPIVRFGSDVHAARWPIVEALVDRLRAEDVDVVVAMPHWGFEFEYWPHHRQRADAHRLIAAGVDVVLGSSPHVLQPVEVVSVNGWDPRCPVQLESEGPPRAGVVAYSLGNFVSSMPTMACNTGCVLSLTLALGESGVVGVAMSTHVTASVTRGWPRARRTVSADEIPTHRRKPVLERATEALSAHLIAVGLAR